MGVFLSPVLLDTHVVYWWSLDPDQLSTAATEAIQSADELAIAAISWFELAWLASRDRIQMTLPRRAWLAGLSEDVRTVPLTPAIADTAASLPPPFPRDPADRLIYATAIDRGWRLVTKDERLRSHPHPTPITIW